MPVEYIKHLPARALDEIRQILNKWWSGENISANITEANIASIYKTGDPTLLENYRPISLLNTIYKILTAIIKQRLDDGIDHEIQDTQFGFRKHKSTTQPIHCIRIIMETRKKRIETKRNPLRLGKHSITLHTAVSS